MKRSTDDPPLTRRWWPTIRRRVAGRCMASVFIGCLMIVSAHADAESEVKSAVNRYFEVWSAQDMKAYAGCFHSDAVILYVGSDGRLIRSMLAPFVESQRLAHAGSQAPMKEVPTRIQIQTSDQFASALVHWELTTAKDVKRGVDVFSFIKQGKDWKIAALVFGDEH